MGLFNFLKSNINKGQFVSEDAFYNNCDHQLQMTPMTLEQLRKIDITDDQELKLEFFFYTNLESKAEQLATEISKLNYTVEYGISEGDKRLYIITGWTTKMKMTDIIVQKWTKQMCELGYKFDCDFDGWGTTASQE